jgi:hypothetical protein
MLTAPLVAQAHDRFDAGSLRSWHHLQPDPVNHGSSSETGAGESMANLGEEPVRAGDDRHRADLTRPAVHCRS